MTPSSETVPTTELPPPDIYDPVVEVYMRDVDRSLLRERLKLTPAERVEKYTSFLKELESLRGVAMTAGRKEQQ